MIQKKKNITNVELSNKTNIGVQQISYYHTGDRTPPLKSLEKIANALGCEMVELIGLSNSEFYHSYNSDGEWLGIRKK